METLGRRDAIRTATAAAAVVTYARSSALALIAQPQAKSAALRRRTALSQTSSEYAPLPPDDPRRRLVIASPDADQSLPHIGLVGDTYTITLSGQETGGRFCVIDMHIPPGGGPAPHRHDFEETFILLEGEMETTFRGRKSTVHAGQTVHVPANAPHQFHNASSQSVRLLCICSPAGQEEFFREVGVPVAARTTAPPKLDAKQQAEFLERAKALAPKYRTELLKEA